MRRRPWTERCIGRRPDAAICQLVDARQSIFTVRVDALIQTVQRFMFRHVLETNSMQANSSFQPLQYRTINNTEAQT